MEADKNEAPFTCTLQLLIVAVAAVHIRRCRRGYNCSSLPALALALTCLEFAPIKKLHGISQYPKKAGSKPVSNPASQPANELPIRSVSQKTLICVLSYIQSHISIQTLGIANQSVSQPVWWTLLETRPPADNCPSSHHVPPSYLATSFITIRYDSRTAPHIGTWIFLVATTVR